MSSYEWIICERRGRWAAAMRTAITRHARTGIQTPRIYEVRGLGELAERIAEKPHSLALIEVHPGTIAQVLSWCVKPPIMYRHARFVALLDHSLVSNDEHGGAAEAGRRNRLVDVLLEAGAVEIVFSPRQLPKILSTAFRHAEIWESRRRPSDENQAISDWAWSLLPWQTQ